MPAGGDPGFPTVFGRNLVAELADFVPRPFVVATMEDLLPKLAGLPVPEARIYPVDSMDREALELGLAVTDDAAAFVGIGGGRALDAAKYFAWRKRRPLFQLPTSLSVDAAWGHRAAVREGGAVRYLGWARPEAVYLDLDLIRSAPALVNRCGIGDVLCFFTGVLDWRHAASRDACEARWPYDPRLAERSLARAEAILEHSQEVRDLTDVGIRVLVEGLRWGGGSFHAAGWNPRHVEGVEHFFFYALERKTGRAFLHGQPVCLGVLVGALLHDWRAKEIGRAIREIGVDIRPEAMGVDWQSTRAALLGLPEFVRAEGLWYGIANDATIDDRFVDRLQSEVEALFGPWPEGAEATA